MPTGSFDNRQTSNLQIGAMIGATIELNSLRIGECAFDFFGLEAGDIPDFRESDIEIIAAETGVAVCGEHFKDSAIQLKHRDIECAATEIVNGDLRPLSEAVESVGQCGSRRFTENTLHSKTRQLPCPLSGGALGVVEVGRNGNDCAVHGNAAGLLEIGFEF